MQREMYTGLVAFRQLGKPYQTKLSDSGKLLRTYAPAIYINWISMHAGTQALERDWAVQMSYTLGK